MGGATGRAEVMVIEDDFAIRETLRELLEEEGYRVVWAANGLEALSRLQRGQPPQLILLDLMMPVMDGWEFRRAQRGDSTLASIPVVVMSADATADHEPEELAADAFLPKPFELGRLLDTVHRYC